MNHCTVVFNKTTPMNWFFKLPYPYNFTKLWL